MSTGTDILWNENNALYRPSQSRTSETESETCTFRTSLFHKYAQLLRERDLSWMNENESDYLPFTPWTHMAVDFAII